MVGARSRLTPNVGGNAALVMGLAVSACAVFDPGSGLQDELTARRQAWEALGITDYVYQLQVVCFCPPEVTNAVEVSVQRGSITSLSYVTGGEPVDSMYHPVFVTVDELFAIIQDAIDREAASLGVAYDNAMHYPTRVRIDYSLEAVDEEIEYRASELVPVAP